MFTKLDRCIWYVHFRKIKFFGHMNTVTFWGDSLVGWIYLIYLEPTVSKGPTVGTKQLDSTTSFSYYEDY